MRAPVIRCLLAIVPLVIMGCTGEQQQAKPVVDQMAIEARIDSLNTAWTGAIASKDSNLVAGMYADDAHVLPANDKRVDGKDGIRHVWATMLQMPGFDLKPTSNTKIVSEAGDLVVDLGTYEMNAMGPKGKPIHDTGKYVTVLKNVNGEWKIVVDTFNSDMPMPGAASK